MKEESSSAGIREQVNDRPISRHSRHVTRACAVCRRRKTKCDGAEPTCGTCMVQGQQCEYSSEPDRRRTKDANVIDLTRKVAELERQLRALLAREQQWPLLSCTLKANDSKFTREDAVVISCVPRSEKLTQTLSGKRVVFVIEDDIPVSEDVDELQSDMDEDSQ